MYAKIFQQIYDSSVCEDWQVMITFQQLLILSNQDGVVDMTPEAISRRTNIPLEIISHGIEKLEQPDNRSRCRDMDGRRIARLDERRDWGWFIVNYQHYREMAKAEEKREADRIRIADKREQCRKESHDVAECREQSQDVENSRRSEAEGYVEEEVKDKSIVTARVTAREQKHSKANGRFAKPSLVEVQAYCFERRNNVEAQRFIDHYEANGWKVGRVAMKDWKAAVRTWEKNEHNNSRLPKGI